MSELPPSPNLPGGEAVDGVAPLRILWVGDATMARRYVSRRAPHLHIFGGDAAFAGRQILLSAQERSLDLLVIDVTTPSVNPFEILAMTEAAGLDLPLILLMAPGQETVAAEIGGLVVCDCIVKTQDFVLQLLPTVVQVTARHDVLTVLRQTRQREERFRTILESQPAVAGVVDQEGRIAAMNLAGLECLGAPADEVIGRPFTDFIPAEEQGAVLQLFRPEGPINDGSVDHALVRADGAMRRVRTRSVRLAQFDGPTTLVTLDDLTDQVAAAAGDAELESLETAVAALTAEREALEQARARDVAESSDALRQAESRHETERVERQMERRQLLEAVEELRARCHTIDAERLELARELQELDALYQAERATSGQERHSVATALEETNERYESLAAQARKWEETAAAHEAQAITLRDVEAERDHLAAALHAAQARCSELAARHQLDEDVIRSAELQQLASQAVLHEAEFERARLAAALSEAEARSATLEAAWSAERADWILATGMAAAERTALAQAFEAEQQRLGAALQNALMRVEALASDGQQWRGQAATAVARQASADAVCRDLEGERNRLAADLREVQARSASQADEWSAERAAWIRAAEKAAAAHAAEVQGLQARAEALEVEQRHLEQETAAAVARQAQEMESAGAWRSQSERLAAALQEAEGEGRKLGAELRDLRARLETVSAERQQSEEANAAAQASRARDGEAIDRLEGECRRLTEALREAEAQRAAASRSAEETPKDGAELEAARARCQHLVEELSILHSSLADMTRRETMAVRDLAASEARAAAIASRMDSALADDQRGLVELRRDLMQFLCDADSRCKAIVDRRATAREEWTRWRHTLDAAKGRDPNS